MVKVLLILLVLIVVILIYRYWEKIKLITAMAVIIMSSVGFIFFMYIRNSVRNWYMLRKK